MKHVGLVLEGGGQRGVFYERRFGLHDGAGLKAPVCHRSFSRFPAMRSIMFPDRLAGQRSA